MGLISDKLKYKHLYLLTFNDKSRIIFRLLTWKEYKAYRELFYVMDNVRFQLLEEMFLSCVVEGFLPRKISADNTYEIDINRVDAGVVETVCGLIYKLSGSHDADQLVNDLAYARYQASSDAEYQILSAISVALKYKLEDFDELCWPEVLNVIAHGENIIAGKMPTPPFTLESQTDVSKRNAIDFEKENRELKEF